MDDSVSGTDELSVSAAQLLDVYDALLEAGAQPEFIEERCNIAATDFERLDGRIGAEKAVRLWNLLYEQSGDPLCALKVGRLMRPKSMGVLANFVLSCETVREALNVGVRFFGLTNEVDRIRYDVVDGVIRYRYENVHARYYTHWSVDRSLAAAVTWAEGLVRDRVPPLEVRFRYPEPKWAADFEEFFGVPVHFGCDANEILFDAAILDRTNPAPNDYLKKLLSGRARQLAENLSGNRDLVQRIRSLLLDALPNGEGGVEFIAQELQMSRVTLYRKLRERSTSFKEILDDLRRDLSDLYLRELGIPQEETALLLGFSERSSFHRAYRRWYGESPGRRVSSSADG